LYFTANPNGEAEVINVALKPMSKLRKLTFDQDIAEITIKGRASQGNILTKYAIKKVTLKSKGVSTLAGRKIWYDQTIQRINENGHGRYLGEFQAEDKIICVFNDGSYELTSFDLTNHFDDKMMRIEKYNPDLVFSCIHLDGKSKNYFIKRFTFEDLAIGKRSGFINEEPGSKMILLSSASHPVVKIESLKGKSQLFDEQDVDLAELIEVKGIKAQGNKLSAHDVQKVVLISEEFDEEVEVEETLDFDDEELETNEEIDSEELESSKEEIISEKSVIEVIIDSEAKEKITALQKPIIKNEEKSKAEESKPERKIDFEITNPDDIKLDDKGQLGLF
jgi:topoisomerase-4 subunit A